MTTFIEAIMNTYDHEKIEAFDKEVKELEF